MKTFKYMLALCMWATATISMAQGVRVWKNGTFHEYSSTAVDSLTFFAKSTAPETPDDPDKPITVGDLTLTTLAADSLDITSALFKARVDGLDKLQAGSYSVVFFYSKDTNDPNANKGTRVNATVSDGMATFKATGLSMPDTYYYRVAVLMFSGDIAYGAVRSFTVKDIITPGSAVNMGRLTVASCDLGSDKPEGKGSLYAWGETEIKSSYTKGNYVYYNKALDLYLDLGESISGTQYDAATKELGSDWRMPTSLDILYLAIMCRWESIVYKGVSGRIVQSKVTGNAIFISDVPHWIADKNESKDFSEAYYNPQSFTTEAGLRYNGYCIRPVQKTIYGNEDAVDLGLPSGTLWAIKNIGAEKPQDYGDYFAWGETSGYNSGKTDFSKTTYKYYDETNKTYTKYVTNAKYGTVDNKKELEPSDDIATANWGEEWQMPSKEQFDELNKDCKYIYGTIGSVSGWIFYNENNGNLILFPPAGSREGTSLVTHNGYVNYWSRTLCPDEHAYSMYNYFMMTQQNRPLASIRYHGLSVRPVRKK